MASCPPPLGLSRSRLACCWCRATLHDPWAAHLARCVMPALRACCCSWQGGGCQRAVFLARRPVHGVSKALLRAGKGDGRRPARGPSPCLARASAQKERLSASSAVESGLQLFNGGQVDEARRAFTDALALDPNADEARAALYNRACCHSRLKNWQQAADDVVEAVNEHGLKLSVALKDPDLRALRERREWLDALEVAKGGVTTKAFVAARAEAKAPFRFVRIFLFGGLAAGAGLGLVIITGRLIAALRGGTDAPDLTESLLNFSINSAALAAFSFLLIRDIRSQGREQDVIAREEALSRLLVSMGPTRVVPLARLRGSYRPVILAGRRSYISKAKKAAEALKPQLLQRGIILIPVISSDLDPDDKVLALKAELRGEGGGASSRGFGAAPFATPDQVQATLRASKQEGRWELQAYDVSEWRSWLVEQKATAGVGDEDTYMQVQLDGTVRASGAGVPPWEAFLGDLAPLDSLQTKLSDGIGTSR